MTMREHVRRAAVMKIVDPGVADDPEPAIVDTRTRPGTYDYRRTLTKPLTEKDLARPERWEMDVDITSVGTFDFRNGKSERRP